MTGSLGLDNELSVTWKGNGKLFSVFLQFLWPGGSSVARPDHSPLTTVLKHLSFVEKI